MTGRKSLVSLGSEQDLEAVDQTLDAAETATDTATEEDYILEDEWLEPEADNVRDLGWVLPALAILAIAAWTAFFVWADWSQYRTGITPSQGVAIVVEWSIPTLLVITLWLLAMRHSTREAGRFADAANALSKESQALEMRLITVNRELSLAREFIAAQSRDLDSLGRLAAERLSENADRLQGLIRDNGAQVDRIGSVSESALGNMDRLRDQLPVIANAARDVTSQIGNAGQVAQGQLEELVGGFDRLSEFGDSSGRKVEELRLRVQGILEDLGARSDELDRISEERLAALTSRSESFRVNLEARETDTLAAIRRRADTLENELADRAAALDEQESAALANLHERLEVLRSEMDKAGQALDDNRTRSERIELERLAAMDERLAQIDADIAERQETHLAHVAQLTEYGEALAERLRGIDEQMGELASRGETTRSELGDAAGLLSARLEETRGSLAESADGIARLTSDGVRLLEIIRSSADHSRGALSESIEAATSRLAAFEAHANGLAETVETARLRGEELSAHIDRTQSGGSASLETIQTLESRLADLATRSDELAAKARGELTQALETLEAASAASLDTLRREQAETIREIGETIGQEGSGAIKAALREGAGEAIEELGTAALQASQSGHDTAVLLREQLGRVNELVHNLEARIAQARESAEQEMDSSFARSMALIVESLNSSAIDITKAFDTDVTDTAWASYLRGDRGIFTRRAVRLLDSGEARAVADVYTEDDAVRETINRYIHDFEAMLRNVLSTRDGNAMAVALLSSDMGKLYVALAQSIERFRN